MIESSFLITNSLTDQAYGGSKRGNSFSYTSLAKAETPAHISRELRLHIDGLFFPGSTLQLVHSEKEKKIKKPCRLNVTERLIHSLNSHFIIYITFTHIIKYFLDTIKKQERRNLFMNTLV